ncbi:hypothetical protein [Burkholderia gladioli]|uniref:hypothetical protein n=1 Tax=Burkholderia gladioli TaxID=28095 RepID=UPI00163E91D8|nr:hypothetical protein [Burkholderia gladioli]
MTNNTTAALTDEQNRAFGSAIAALERLGWTDPAQHMRTLRALLTSPRAAVPEGWKLVPEKHTLDMSIAFAEAWFSRVRVIDDDDIQDAYSALLDAAPAAPVAISAGTEPNPSKESGQSEVVISARGFDAQAVTADGAPAKDVVTREQVMEWARTANIETGWFTEQFIAALGDFAILTRAAVSPATAEKNGWKEAVDAELVNMHSTADTYAGPKEAVKALIDWHVQVALDPAVSAAARSLQVASADTTWTPPKQHCQNGGDVCLAGNRDGVCCPEDSCDIDDGTRKNPATADTTTIGMSQHLIDALFGVVTTWVNTHHIQFEEQNELFRAIGDVVRPALTPPYSAPFTTDVPQCCGEPKTCDDPCVSALATGDERTALRNLRDVLRTRHHGRMPAEVQTAYDEASRVLDASQAAAPADAISLLRKAHRTLACAALTQIRDGEAVWTEIGRFLDAAPAEPLPEKVADRLRSLMGAINAYEKETGIGGWYAEQVQTMANALLKVHGSPVRFGLGDENPVSVAPADAGEAVLSHADAVSLRMAVNTVHADGFITRDRAAELRSALAPFIKYPSEGAQGGKGGEA